MSQLLRVWRRAPFPAALAVLSLAVGWAVTTVVASAWVAFRFGPLPYRHGEQTYAILAHDTWAGDVREWSLTRTEYVASIGRSLPPKFTFLLQTYDGASLQAPGVDRHIGWDVVSPGFFEALGVSAERGRVFGAADSASGNTHVVVLSQRLWRTAFNGQESVIGSRVYLGSVQYEVIGVMSRQLDAWTGGSNIAEAWIPMTAGWIASKDRNHASQGFITGVTRENRAEAETAVRVAVDDLHRALPGKTAHLRVELGTLRRYLFEREWVTLLLPIAVAGASGILFISCLNFAVLVLLRGAARQREFAIRSALGASPWRIVGRVLAEGQVLVAIALVIGVLLATWLVQGLHLFGALVFPGWIEPGLNWRVAALVTVAGVATGALFAVPAARLLRRSDAQQTLRTGGGSATFSGSTLRLVDALVFGELLITAVALPIGVMFAVRTLREARLDVGYDYSNLVRATMEGRRAGGPGTARTRVPTDFAKTVAAIGGVTSTSAGYLSHAATAGAAAGAGPAPHELDESPLVGYSAGSLLRTMQAQLLAGRFPSATEEASLAPVALLSKSAARQLFGAQNPIGMSVFIQPADGAKTNLTVIGVVNDMRTSVFQRSDAWGAVFTLIPSPDSMNASLYARLPDASAASVERLRAQLARAVPGADVMSIATVESSLRSGLSQLRVMAFTFGAIASVFVILAVAGVFGATAYSVRLRLREVGIRRALGATDGNIAALVTRSTARRALAASVIGLSLGIIAVDQIANDGNLLTNQPGTVALTVAAMLLVVLAGALGPVLRGLRVSPMEVLRDE